MAPRVRALGVYRDGLLHVMADRCSTCIFRPGNLMHLERGRVGVMVRECLSDPLGGASITCHDTLSGPQAICRGFWDGHAQRQWRLMLAEAMGIVREVEP